MSEGKPFLEKGNLAEAATAASAAYAASSLHAASDAVCQRIKKGRKSDRINGEEAIWQPDSINVSVKIWPLLRSCAILAKGVIEVNIQAIKSL